METLPINSEQMTQIINKAEEIRIGEIILSIGWNVIRVNKNCIDWTEILREDLERSVNLIVLFLTYKTPDELVKAEEDAIKNDQELLLNNTMIQGIAASINQQIADNPQTKTLNFER